HPTAEWTSQQLREAFPFDQVPRYLLRDRDGIFGCDFTRHVKAMGIKEVLSAPRSPWQRAYVERVIGTIRRECLDHVIVFSEASLRRTLLWYFTYYHGARTHLSLSKDAPDTRPVHPTRLGRVNAHPQHFLRFTLVFCGQLVACSDHARDRRLGVSFLNMVDASFLRNHEDSRIGDVLTWWEHPVLL